MGFNSGFKGLIPDFYALVKKVAHIEVPHTFISHWTLQEPIKLSTRYSVIVSLHYFLFKSVCNVVFTQRISYVGYFMPCYHGTEVIVQADYFIWKQKVPVKNFRPL